PYFTHPLEVAGILTEMRLDDATIATALLHDTIEDTLATREELEDHFGEEVARLVDGVTKLSQLEISSESQHQAENFRKFVVAMSNDIRVLLVKLADRLHNMRTLHHIPNPDKRRRIAMETIDIYAPLAERIGMQAMKTELEDLSFLHLNPDARASILARLEFLTERAGNIEGRVIDLLKSTLADEGIDVTILGRRKQPYSIWRKMQEDNVAFEQLSDVMAFRIIVNSVEECYRALGVVHSTWPAVPSRFKDYISTPKRNNYQSLHTTVIGPEQQRIEIQIRTRQMHEIATYGVAAHWQYKQHAERLDGTQYRWLRELLEILEHAESPEEFLEHTKIALYSDQVFCFTPKGDLISLPRGATPLDFAYAVHTDVGNSCVGAKVNGVVVPLRTALKNGDQVEILRSSAQTPSTDWEDIAVTGRARSAIRRFLRFQGLSEYARVGKGLVEQTFARAGYDFESQTLEPVLEALSQESLDHLLAEVGQGKLSARRVLEAAFPEEKDKQKRGEVPLPAGLPDSEAHSIQLRGANPGTAMRLGQCCHPLPGDRIVGLIAPGVGVIVHTIDCESLKNASDNPDDWVDLSWEPDAWRTGYHLSTITLSCVNEPGALGQIATMVGRSQGNITNIKLVERTVRAFSIVMDIEVRDVKHLTNIIAALRTLTVVAGVERLRG
ncbi:MAG: bifunctional (p)ppGpp synthetase/guanosine-3',5'-bis(diphosphate) 3'-pyrophosphohydrolase, partial [Alphaproteobacteria bacterium]|nr:bifunctional (p)ppGpp synthetase/guanosine-3',5'-bis(diphosphate) 3'-pyrophosphohydrolase [Alphaproteobacteria bacterium]